MIIVRGVASKDIIQAFYRLGAAKQTVTLTTVTLKGALFWSPPPSEQSKPSDINNLLTISLYSYLTAAPFVARRPRCSRKAAVIST